MGSGMGGYVIARRGKGQTSKGQGQYCHTSEFSAFSPEICSIHSSFDPLHFPSLVLFSLSLLRPARRQLGASIFSFVEKLKDWQVGLALVGSFCFGVGIGLILK